MRNIGLGFGIVVLNSVFALSALAGSLTIRDIQVKGNKIEIQLDGVAPKGAVDLDYVRDIVQFSIQNSTIYPAKILHSENQAFTKVFAYQYAPNLVRVRFSVDGQSEIYKGKVKWQQSGKLFTVIFPEGKINAPKPESKSDSKSEAKQDDSSERSLLAKVLGTGKKEVKVEAITDQKSDQKPVEVKSLVGKSKSRNSSRLTGAVETHETTLGGAHNGPSAFRSFLAMFLVVGGLGLILVYVKKKKSSVQATKVGESWLSNLIPQGMRKHKSLIEVIAQHSLGAKQSITVVRIRGQQFILGVSQDNVQLISQLDADESELGLLDDPAVAASIGKMFGGKPKVESIQSSNASFGAAFSSLMKAAPEAPAYFAEVPVIRAQQNGIRDQIRRRLEGMKNV